MAKITQVPVATSFVAGEALDVGYSIVGLKSDGKIYKAIDDASILRVVGYTAEAAAIGDTVTVFPGIDEFGKPICLECKNSATHALATTAIGTKCYIEGHATVAGSGYGDDWTVASSSTNSVVAGIFRGFTGAMGAGNLRVAVEIGRRND